MKRVSFNVAKAIKEAGYPQEKLTDKVYLLDCDKEGKLAHYQSALYYNVAVAPTYMEVWLWLWREKDIPILLDKDQQGLTCVNIDYGRHIVNYLYDPEEAIIAGIEHIVEHKLLK